jgi:hypothetical protein
MRLKSWLAIAAGAVAVLAVALFVASHFTPEVLAFPYHRVVDGVDVYAETPIGPGVDRALARADGLLATSAINAPLPGRRVFLTNGVGVGRSWP